MSPFWQRRVGEQDAALAWIGRARAAAAAARLLADQGFLPETVTLSATAIRHAARAALAHAGRDLSADLATDFEAGLVRPNRVHPRFLEVLHEAQEWRARTERDPSWSPPGEETRQVLARTASFLSGIEALIGQD